MQDIKILHEFYATDRSDRLRRIQGITRERLILPEVNYGTVLNTVIEQGLSEGIAIQRPEAGLIYAALRTEAALIDELLGRIDAKSYLFFNLNDRKIDLDWAWYVPFTLTIRDFDHLWAFVRGEITLLVLADPTEMETIASRGGGAATFDEDDLLYPLKVDFPDGDGRMQLSWQALARIGMECVSPDWLIRETMAASQRHADRAGGL